MIIKPIVKPSLLNYKIPIFKQGENLKNASHLKFLSDFTASYV